MSKKLTPRQRYGARWQMAAQMVARGEKTRQQIASEINVTAGTLAGWESEDAEFIAEVERIIAEIRAAMIAQAVLTKTGRNQIRAEMVQKLIAATDKATKTELSRLSNAIDKLLISTAIENGEWREQVEHTGANGAPIQIAVKEIIIPREPVDAE